MLTIKVLGPYPSCIICISAEDECKKAAKAFPGLVEVAHEDMLTAEYGLYRDMVPPIILIGSELASTGKIMLAEKLKEQLQARLNQ